MSKLLINESPLVVLPSLAEAVGLDEAIVLQQIQYWINVPTGGRNIEGVKWIWNTLEEWQKQFPFWSVRKIKLILKRLRDRNLIHVSQFNKSKWDRTNFYTINYESLDQLVLTDSTRECTIEDSSPCTFSYTETTTDTNAQNKEQPSKAVHDRKEEKKRNDDEQFEKFWSSYGNKKDKKRSRSAFLRLSKADMKLAIDGINDFQSGKESKFVSNPATYINGRRWEDESSGGSSHNAIGWE